MARLTPSNVTPFSFIWRLAFLLPLNIVMPFELIKAAQNKNQLNIGLSIFFVFLFLYITYINYTMIKGLMFLLKNKRR